MDREKRDHRKPMPDFPSDFDQTTIGIIKKVLPYTQTSPERIFALCEAVKYISLNKIPGAIVECGVWKGGSIMAIENMLLKLQDHNREIYLFDTFDGMTPPTDKDVSYMGVPASATLSKQEKSDQDSLWNYVSLKAVKKAVLSVGYNKKKIHFIKGKVEDTLPSKAPKTISLLRLDTDWYESTRHELATLFPRISTSGVLIVDDYGHWKGARHAMDEYIKEKKIKIMLNRIDYTGRIGIVLH